MYRENIQFKEGAEVFDLQGEKVGEIDRVVLDPRTKEVSHVVIREGFLFPEDKVVPVDWFAQATEDEAILRATESDVDALPPFEETHYIPSYEARERSRTTREYARSHYWYPPTDVYWWGHPGYNTYFGFTEPPVVKTLERNIPDGSVALEEGANVISADNDHVGNIERIFVDPATNRASHFVISQGMIFKDKKLVPTAWIESLTEDRVYLSVEADFLDQLEGYRD